MFYFFHHTTKISAIDTYQPQPLNNNTREGQMINYLYEIKAASIISINR